MSVVDVRNIIGKFKSKFVITLPLINLTKTQKILIVCLTSGTLLLGGLAQFLKRRRRHPASFARRFPRDGRYKYINGKGSNLDTVSQVSWARKSEASTRSHASDRGSLISSVPGGPDGDIKLTPQQYGVLAAAPTPPHWMTHPPITNLGKDYVTRILLTPRVTRRMKNVGHKTRTKRQVTKMPTVPIQTLYISRYFVGLEALERALYCWEDALTAFSSSLSSGDALALPSKADAAFTHDVQELLDLGYHIQNTAELLFIDQHSVLFRNDPECNDSDAVSEESRRPSISGVRASSRHREKQDAASSPESFESARDGVADLREFEEFSEFFPHFEKQKLYHSALKQHEDKGIPCRRLHTELVKCGSDVEYLAKVHCLRQAFSRLFAWPVAASWIADMGRQLISDLIVYADRDPKEYLVHYEAMLEFIQDSSKRNIMQEELAGRNVKCINFYDVLIDFILLDAFDEVEKPPSSIKAILQNRWISASFRETAIGTAVWSVLMGKRQMLKYSKGFLAHFYSISEQISPVLVWGFLGPEGSLRSTCNYFREQVVEFLVDIFNFFKVRYTTVEELAEDILREIKTRVGNVNQRLSLEGC